MIKNQFRIYVKLDIDMHMNRQSDINLFNNMPNLMRKLVFFPGFANQPLPLSTKSADLFQKKANWAKIKLKLKGNGNISSCISDDDEDAMAMMKPALVLL